MNILAAFGGIAGLFLGCSLFTAVEVIYLILIEIPQVLFTECRSASKGHNSEELTTNQNNINAIVLKRNNFNNFNNSNNFQRNLRFVQPQSKTQRLPPLQYNISDDISSSFSPTFYYE